MFSTAVCPSTPKRLAMSMILSGRNVPSASKERILGQSWQLQTGDHTDVSYSTIAATLFDWKLGHDTESVSQLSLAAAEFSEDFIDAARLKATFENAVPLLAASRETEAGLA